MTWGHNIASRRRMIAGALLGLSLLLSATGMAASADTPWTTTGPMTAARNGQAAALLPDGDVLVAGGHSAASPYGPLPFQVSLASAERYHPATNTWSPAASMATARDAATATLLPNGQVLVVGGSRVGEALPPLTFATAERYDPIADAWSPAGQMATPRSGQTATLLLSGKVLVVGGQNGTVETATAELYDPATNTWSSAGTMSTPRRHHTATLLPSGKVLVAGGSDGSALASAELYDPATNGWAAAATMSLPRASQAAALLPNGKVLVVGGSGAGGAPLASGEIYDPVANTWLASAPMSTPRSGETATALLDGQVLVAGGASLDDQVSGSAERYDPSSDSWTSAGALSVPRALQAATLLGSGQVLVTGGAMDPSADLYTPSGSPPDLSGFGGTWARTDRPVAGGAVARTWIWGPAPDSGVLYEPYAGAPGGFRAVVYYDKSRMEITNPYGDPGSLWHVTNGLLAEELVTGRLQLGDSAFAAYAPAQIAIAGDPADPNAPTYATFGALLGTPAAAGGSQIVQTVDRAANVADDPALGSYGVTAVDVGSPTAHTVASVFWDFMNGSGPVDQGGQQVTAPLFPNPFYATGYPITEAYWTHVLVGGVSRQVLVQVFERRVLTFTPGNPAGWQVESGNVGLHYVQWRYGHPAGSVR